MAIKSAMLDKLVPSPQTDRAYSDEVLIGHMVEIERAYLSAMGQLGLIDGPDSQIVLAALDGFAFNAEKLRDAGRQDGVVVPELVKELRQFASPKTDKTQLIHQGLTSQDVIDTGLAMSWRSLNIYFDKVLREIIDQLDSLEAKFGQNAMMGRTRMQAALEINVVDRLRNWRLPIQELQNQFTQVRENLECVTLGGAVGDARSWGNQTAPLAREMAKLLQLNTSRYNLQTNRLPVNSYGAWLTQASGQAGKIGFDIALMAQQGIDEVRITGAGASSAMAHKANPVMAETLVSLGRYNAALMGGLSQALIHEQERSGAAWTLEWLIMPQILATTEASLVNLHDLLHSIASLGQV